MATARAPQFGHHLECSICIETYSLSEHLPKTIPCGHTFCNICLEKLNINGKITCPNCKKQHTLPVEGVHGFPTNHAITGMLEFACGICQSYCQTSRCPHCPLQLCTACMEDHVQPEYKPSVEASVDHNLDLMREIKQNLPVFVDKVNNIMSKCGTFCDKSKVIIQKRQDIDSLQQIQQQSTLNAASLREVNKVLLMDIPDVDPDLSCFTDVEYTAGNTTSDKPRSQDKPEKMSQTSGKRTPSHVTRSRDTCQMPVTYNSVPRLVWGTPVSGAGEFDRLYGAAVDVHSGNIHVADGLNKRICVYDNDYGYKSEYDVGCTPWDLCSTGDGHIAVTCGDTVKIYDVSGNVKQVIGSKGEKLCEFYCPMGIASDNEGLLHVCDSKNHRVQVMDQAGSVVRVLGTRGPGKLEDPWSVAVHPLTGQVYVADYKKEQVNIYSHDGQYGASIGKDDIPGVSSFCPWYVSFRSDGLLCISDADNHCIHLVRDGRVIQRIGKYGSAPGQFWCPTGTAFTQQGDIVICDPLNHRIQMFTAQ